MAMVNRHRERDAESEPLMADDSLRNDVAVAGIGIGIDAVSQTDEHRRASVANVASGHPDAPLETIDTVLEVDDSSSGGSNEPRFLADERSSKQWGRVPYPVRRVFLAVVKWSRGPPNPQPFRIRPLFPAVQEYPLHLVDRFLSSRKLRAWVLCTYLIVWLVAFVLVKRRETTSAEIAGWGTAQPIGCGDTYWGSGNSCGLDGTDCRPFNNSGFAFSCPASCAGYHVLNPRAVGDQEIVYRSLVIGGPPNDAHPESAIYRGDSFLCGAAVHAGVITNDKGGCGVVELIGQQQGFVSSQRNGIASVGFDSYFPIAFRFTEGVRCSSKDERWALLTVSVVFTTLLSLATLSPSLFFFPTFVGTFWTVGMATDQPTHSTVAGLFSTVLGRFLPAMFCAWVIFDKMGVRRTLTRLTAQVEKTVLWLGACWVGALTNYTFDFIPIQRLNKHDIDQQPGAKAALAVIVIVLVAVVGSQIWFFRQEGRAIKYLKLYVLLLVAIGVSLSLPGLQLRIHHYILALLLLPGTSIQTRPSLLYQGLLVGLFVNGIARWGFDPVLQTPAALLGDGQQDTALPVLIGPAIAGNASGNSSSITFRWADPPSTSFDGISVLVNDVERFRSYFGDDVDHEDAFVWTRDDGLDLPEYFRFAFMSGSSSGDYTKAGTWAADGHWIEMDPGPSKVKARSVNPEERMLNRHR